MSSCFEISLSSNNCFGCGLCALQSNRRTFHRTALLDHIREEFFFMIWNAFNLDLITIFCKIIPLFCRKNFSSNHVPIQRVSMPYYRKSCKYKFSTI
ncbi:protein of unknown function [Azospirillum lipoferum 4B]|uniref:Uncharacterized protein n=1 Tax=Azospirillum lipoferum (strain 4B) TaxID=862719 RepID=G7Z839_AZOL4|nr:protein of unknown function [Azospirillum lipoferum 4B]